MKSFRPYQEEMFNKVLESWMNGVMRVLAWAFTGWGKTFLTASVSEFMLSKGFKIVVAVRTRELVFNLYNEFKELGIDSSILMSGEENDPNSPVQICSIDTLNERKVYPYSNEKNVVLIIDEAHMSKSDDFQNFIKAYISPYILGVTATPFNDLDHFDVVHETITPSELRDKGYLVDYVTVAPSVQIETEGVKKINGDFAKKSIIENTKNIFGDIVEAYLQFNTENRPTLAFLPDVKTSKEIAQKFNERGINAAHIDAKTSDAERAEIEECLKSGKLTVVCNVALWTTGKNIPEISCILDAAPTHNQNLWVQKVGRGSRVGGSFSDCLYIDIAGNTYRHGFFYDERLIESGDKKKSHRIPDDLKIQACKKCFKYFKTGPKSCPHCGNREEVKYPVRSTVDGKLRIMTEEDHQAIVQRMMSRYSRQLWWKVSNLPFAGNWSQDRKKEWVNKKFKEKYGRAS